MTWGSAVLERRKWLQFLLVLAICSLSSQDRSIADENQNEKIQSVGKLFGEESTSSSSNNRLIESDARRSYISFEFGNDTQRELARNSNSNLVSARPLQVSDLRYQLVSPESIATDSKPSFNSEEPKERRSFGTQTLELLLQTSKTSANKTESRDNKRRQSKLNAKLDWPANTKLPRKIRNNLASNSPLAFLPKLIICTLIVLGGIAFGAVYLRKHRVLQSSLPNEKNRIQVLDKISISQRAQLILLQVGSRPIIVGIDKSGINKVVSLSPTFAESLEDVPIKNAGTKNVDYRVEEEKHVSDKLPTEKESENQSSGRSIELERFGNKILAEEFVAQLSGFKKGVGS